ncbi:MAG: DUF2963 domain-containing protein, partial [Candidatus Phytoplasma sp. TWB_XP]
MSSFRIGNKHYKIIPFLITTGTLLFFVFWIGGLAYKYHLETEERRILLTTDVKQKARELNSQVHEEIEKLKKENELLKKEIDKLILEPFKQILYYPDGKTINSITQFHPQTGKSIKET